MLEDSRVSRVRPYVQSWRFLVALLFIPRSLRDATLRAWVEQLERETQEMQREALMRGAIR
jgi:hypothetical protein